MVQLFQGAGEGAITARQDPVKYLFSRGAEAGQQGTAIEKIGAKLSDVGDAYINQEQDNEVRNIQVQAAKLHLAAQSEIDNAARNGTPDDLAAVQQKYQGLAQNLGSKAQYQRGAEAAQLYGTDVTERVNQSVFAAQAKQYGYMAQSQSQTYTDTLSGIVTNDPTQLPDAMDKVDTFAAGLKGISPAHQQAIATEMKQNVNYSAAKALVTSNPIVAEKELSNGKFFLSAEQRGNLIGQAQTQQRLDQETVLQNMHLKLLQQTIANNEAMKGYVGKIARNEPFDLSDLSKDPALTFQGVNDIYKFQQDVRDHGLAAASQSNPEAVSNIMQRLTLNPTDPKAITFDNFDQEIDPLVHNGQLSLPDKFNLEKLVKGVRDNDPNYIKMNRLVIASRQFYQQTGSLDPESDSYAFMNYALGKMAQYQQDGKDLDKTLFNPSSPEYIASNESLLTAKKTIGAAKAASPTNYKVGHAYPFSTADGKTIQATYLGGDASKPAAWKPLAEKTTAPASESTGPFSNFPASKKNLENMPGGKDWKPPSNFDLHDLMPSLFQPGKQ